ncbi:MAG: PAS domain S-box protein [bacterium]
MEELDKSKADLFAEIKSLRKEISLLQAERDNYKSIIDYSNHAILLTAPDGRIFSANPTACKMFGMTEDEICVRGRNGIVDQSDPNLPILIEEREKNGKATGELHFIKGDNSKFLGHITSVVFHDPDGQKRTSISIQDITESRKTESYNKFLADILTKVSDAVIAVDEDMKITYWNDAAEMIYGWTSDEMKGKVIQEVLPAYFISTTQDEVTAQLISNGFWRGEIIQHNKNGKSINILATTSRHCDKHGKFIGAVTINHDITERKQFEEALKSSETRYRTIFELAPIGISLLNAKREIVNMNPALERITKLSKEELLAGKYKKRKYIRSDGTEIPVEELASTRALKENKPIYDVVNGIITETNEIIWTKVNAAPIKLPNAGVIVITEDITEKKKSEEILRLNETYLKMAQSMANMGNWIWIVKNGSLYWSDELFKIWGVEKNSFVLSFENILNLIHPDDREINQKKVEELLKSSDKGEFEFRIVRPDQQIRYLFQVYEVYRDEAGVPKTAFGIMLDVTEHKRDEEKLRALSMRLQNAKEEEKIQIARELHDNVGQSLTGLKMDLVWILKRLSKAVDKKSLDAIDEKLKSVIPITDSIIQSIRQISADLRPNILDTLGLLPAIEWQLEEFKKRTNISYEFVHEISVINLDQLRSTAIYRIFQEMLTNIIRHSKATEIICRIMEGNNNLILLIEDNGIGIPENKLNDLNSLGLIGMRERAILLGGEIKIIPADGKGTKIILTVPMEKKND